MTNITYLQNNPTIQSIQPILIILCHVLLYFFWQEQVSAQENISFNRIDVLRLANSDTLRFAEVLSVINANHPKMQAARLGQQRAMSQLTNSWGSLDWQLGASFDIKQQDGKYKNQQAQAEILFPTYWGPKVSAGFRRSLGFFDNDINTSPSGEYAVTLSVPLWRNVMIDKNRSAILKAEMQLPGAEAFVTAQRNELFVKASEKYWEWSAAFQKLKIADQLLAVSQFRFNSIKSEISKGERAVIDSIEAFQEIQRRIGNLIKSRRDYEKAQIAVAVFLWQTDGTSSKIPPVILPESMPFIKPLTVEQYERDKANAANNRPELVQIQADIGSANIEREFANELWKPDITMKLKPFSQRIGSDIPIDNLDYRLGFDLSLPILQRSASSQVTLAEIKQQEIEIKKKIAIRDITADVEDALSELLSTQELFAAAQKEKLAAEQMERAERELFQRGESNLFTVNIRERSSAEAAQREVDALANYHKAVAKYQWATATY